MRRRVLEGALQRGVADQQRRVGLLAERHVVGLGEQHLRQHDRGRALRRDRHAAHLLERLARDELDRVDGALGGDAEPRQQAQAVGVARVLDRGDRREVELAVQQPRVQLGRHALHLLHLGLEPVEDRRHVHVGDAAEADHDSRSTTASVRASSSSRRRWPSRQARAAARTRARPRASGRARRSRRRGSARRRAGRRRARFARTRPRARPGSAAASASPRAGRCRRSCRSRSSRRSSRGCRPRSGRRCPGRARTRRGRGRRRCRAGTRPRTACRLKRAAVEVALDARLGICVCAAAAPRGGEGERRPARS